MEKEQEEDIPECQNDRDGDSNITSMFQQSSSSVTVSTNPHMSKIFNFLIRKNDVYFKSQQINEPDLTLDEKYSIVSNIFDTNPYTFLTRFGKHLEEEHLNFLEEFNEKRQANDNNKESNDNEIDLAYLLEDLQKNLKDKYQIKNRRYSAMQKMIQESDYFSEKEMMQREPHLYEVMVGQYLTENEKNMRDRYDPKNTLFSEILLRTYDKECMEVLRKKQKNAEEQSDDESTISDSQNSLSRSGYKTPVYEKEWGGFEDEEKAENELPSTSSGQKSKRKGNYQNKLHITAEEREFLRQQFVDTMQSKFLNGEDKEFDYTKIDNNEDFDDWKLIDRDHEDAYFDDDDDDDDDEDDEV